MAGSLKHKKRSMKSYKDKKSNFNYFKNVSYNNAQAVLYNKMFRNDKE